MSMKECKVDINLRTGGFAQSTLISFQTGATATSSDLSTGVTTFGCPYIEFDGQATRQCLRESLTQLGIEVPNIPNCIKSSNK